jgi:hypothetical protein
VELKLNVQEPHVGPCHVHLLDLDLNKEIELTNDHWDCANEKNNEHVMRVFIPAEQTGRKVLRWYMENWHLSQPDVYEDCADVEIISKEEEGHDEL